MYYLLCKSEYDWALDLCLEMMRKIESSLLIWYINGAYNASF